MIRTVLYVNPDPLGEPRGSTCVERTREEEADALDQAMIDSMMAFPAETEGVGATSRSSRSRSSPTAPSASSSPPRSSTGRSSPARIVEAWTYNGMVPGPWIKVDVGDKVEVDVTNDLPLGTDVHWHGISSPNSMDGVAPSPRT
jgi:manganese oxidase